MIRVYDAIGRIKEEIDPTRDDYYLHVSYVREYPPYQEVTDNSRPILPPEVRASPVRVRAAKRRAETIRRQREGTV